MQSRLLRLALVITVVAVLNTVSGGAFNTLIAQEPLRARIDQLVESHLIGPAAPVASDAEFLRRVTLDLTGTLPTAAEARAFLEDASANKREAAVDRLLASPRFPVHMAAVFDLMLMERRPDKHVSTAEWQKYLRESFEANKPYNQLAREILSADGSDAALRAPAKFFLDRDAEPHSSGRDVGRMFFGMDLQCAQCHDHPLVDHYLQADYYGLHAFVNRTELFTDAAQKKSFLAEKSDGDASYKSVFTGDAADSRPRLPGETEIDEPRLRQGEDYVTAPAANVRSVPKYSRRQKLAELATTGGNAAFNRNITNRLWAIVMGRGLVHPVDLHHPANPPSHPAVLDLMTQEFVAQKFDMRWLLRELVLTRTYQRAIDAPADPAPQVAAAAAQLPAVDAETAKLHAASEQSRLAVNAIRDELKAARATFDPIEAAWKKTEAAVTAAKKPVDAARDALAKTQADITTRQTAIATVTEAVAKVTEAAKVLPNDKEIAGTVATLTAKQAQLTTELAAVQKTAADQTAAIEAAQAKLVEAYVPADAAYAAVVEARKPLDAIKTRLNAAWNQHQSEALAASIQKKRRDVLQAHVALGTALSTLASAQAAIEPARADLAAAMQNVEQQQTEVTRQAGLVAESEKLVAEATKSLEDARAQLVTKQGIVQSVAEAIAKSDTALQKLPGDAELTLVVQKLKTRQEPLVKEASAQEQVVSTQEGGARDLAAKLGTLKQGLATATSELTARQQAVATKTMTVNQAVAAVETARGTVNATRNQLVDEWTIAAGVRPLKALSPEQLGWALMTATGVIEPQRPGIDAEIEKTIPKASVAADPVKARGRDFELESLLYEKNRGNLGAFVSMYGQTPGQPQDDFFATPDQALFAANGGTVVGWSAGGQLAQRLGPMTEPAAIADELYLTVLTRRPTEPEIQEVAQQLAARPMEKPVVVRDLVWALVTSVEFRFNH